MTPSKEEARERIITLVETLNAWHGGVAYLGNEHTSQTVRADDLSALLADWTLPPQHSSGDALPGDVIRLVIAARTVAFEDQSPEAIRELDQASEAFAARVPWPDEE